MKFYIAGHGHTFQKNKPFVEWMRKHDTNLLVSFAYPDVGRMDFARQERKRNKVAKKKGKQK